MLNYLNRQAEAVFHSVWANPSNHKIFLLIVGLVVLAVAIIAVPEIMYLGIVLPVFLLIWNRPEFGLFGIIFLSSGFFSPERTEVGMGLEWRDLAFLGVLGLVFLKVLIQKSLSIPLWPAGAALFLFLGLALFSLVNARVFEGVEFNWAFNDMRILLYYCMFFITAWSIQKPKQLGAVLFGLFIIADMIAIGIFAQQYLGDTTFLYEGMASSRGMVLDLGGIVRVVPAAHALLHFMIVLALALMIFSRKSRPYHIVYGLQFILLCASSMLTLTRSQWLATGISIFIMIFALSLRYPRQTTQYSLRVGVPIALLLISLLGFFDAGVESHLIGIPIISGVYGRAQTLLSPEEVLTTNSLEWRQFEFDEAMRSIKEKPVLGVSLGNSYRDITTLQGEAQGWWTRGSQGAGDVSRFTRYVHNSYLAIAVKMGLLGLIVFLCFCLAFVYKSWQLYRSFSFGVIQGMVLAILSGFIGLLYWSIFMTHFIRSESTISIGMMTGLVAAIAHMQTDGELAAGNSCDW